MPQESNKTDLNYTFPLRITVKCNLVTIGPLAVALPFLLIEYDQRMIIKFLLNDGLNGHKIAQKLATFEN
jgi:hypothetical protein